MGLEIGFFIGAAILLGGFIYGAVANTRRKRAHDPIRDQATRELYKDEAAYDDKEDEFRARTRT